MAFNPQPKIFKPKKAKKPLSKVHKATGELNVFEEFIENLDNVVNRCFVCNERITLVTHNNFAHILAKGKYPKYRLNPENLVLLCHKIIADENGNGCHFLYDHTPHSKLKGEGWNKIFKLAQELKEQYKLLK